MLVCFTEEESAKELLDILIPRITGHDNLHRCISFEGKQDLKKQLERKLNGWNVPDSSFLILTDQDSNDCVLLKQRLLKKVCNTGKVDKTKVRIACHELESFYLGDLHAVELALNVRNISSKQNNQKFRAPDRLANAKQELEKLTENKYAEIAGSQLIAPCLNLQGQNKSKSFNVLVETIRTLATQN